MACHGIPHTKSGRRAIPSLLVRRLLFVLLATAVVAVGLLGCSSGDSDGGRESTGLEGPDNAGPVKPRPLIEAVHRIR